MVSLDDIKLPPHNIEAEQGVLCCILLDNDCMLESILLPEHFYQKENSLIYKAIKTLYDKKQNIDVVTLGAQLARTKDFEIVGGNDYLYQVATSLMTTSVFKDYQQIVYSKALYRTIISNSHNVVNRCYGEEDIGGIMDTLKASIDAVDIKTPHQPFLETLMNVIDNLGKQDATICNYGYRDFDQTFHGYKKGQLIVIGARPGVGKSMIALNLALKVAEQGKKAVIFSLEMSREEIAERIISKYARTPSYTFKYMNDEQRQEIGEKTISSISAGFDLDIFDDIYDFHQICQKIRIIKAKQGLDVVYIDYLQLMRTKSTGNKNNDIGDMTTELKRLAMEQGITIVVCCQLNRQSEMSFDKKPELHHLRDSGNIEQDANIVIMPWKDPDDPSESIKILVQKNRGGPTGFDFPIGFTYAHMDMFDAEEVKPIKKSRPLPTPRPRSDENDLSFMDPTGE